MSTTFAVTKRPATYPVAFSRQELYQSQSAEIRAVYDRVAPADRESMTTVRGNDVCSRFRVAYAQVPMTNAQRTTVRHLEIALEYVEKRIDPTRLYFTIDSSPDDDVVLNHKKQGRLCTIIVHDDGSMALSRIYAQPALGQTDELIFVEPEGADYEKLAYQFLSGQ
jgi:hypothetical protein